MAHKVGNNKNNDIEGTTSSDLLEGLGGDDYLFGSDGNDKLLGGDGNDSLWGGAGNDTLIGGNGDDLFGVYKGNETVSGGSGLDLLDFYWATKGVNIDLNENKVGYTMNKTEAKVVYSSIEGVWGSNFGEKITGTDGDNEIFSRDGADTIFGGKGDDIINANKGSDKVFGEEGDDRIVVSPGNDKVDGGSGRNTLDFYYSSIAIDVSISDGKASFKSSEGTGVTTFKNISEIWGGSKNDKLSGSDEGDFLWGSEGNDVVSGLGGKDLINGGSGGDTLSGGAASDMFVFNVAAKTSDADRITDFQANSDILAFRNDAFNMHGVGKQLSFGERRYQMIDADEFQSGTGHSAENRDVRLLYDSKTGSLYYDANGSQDGKLAEVAFIGKGLDLDASSIGIYSL